MNSVSLRKIDRDNYMAIHKLRVAPEQEKFVATNAQSLSQSQFHDDAWARAIYADDQPVGFVMLSIIPEKAEYFLWRFMIDHRHQGCGLGRAALEQVVEYVRTLPRATAFYTSHLKGEGGPEGFYLKFGFEHTGEVEDGEHLMKLDLPQRDHGDERLLHSDFPRANTYHPDWVLENPFGANPLWLTEWLTAAFSLDPGMRVLDLGCGRAKSSIFLAREFGVRVWATDLWISPAENRRRIAAAGLEDEVFPIHADARSLPFAPEFFDAVIAVDSFSYFGNDDLYLNYLAPFVKPGGPIAMAGAGLMRDFEDGVPPHLERFWTQDCWSLHTADWWRRHWQRTGLVDVEVAEPMDDGCQLWTRWSQAVGDCSSWYLDTLSQDRGKYLGYVRVVARRNDDIATADHCSPDTRRSWPVQYHEHPLLRDSS